MSFIIGVLIVMTLPFVVLASDELNLTGVVKEVDARAGVVTIDVKSRSCKGIRTFKSDNIAIFDSQSGKIVSFFINSSSCSGNDVYKITKMISKGEVNEK
ncbi:MAG TPA: hypothetical protein VK448_00735 [Dissulfurispiraceae bacterium]|nr:hypothetical protein [Dissulfurispiraceae bacterium]